MHPEDAEDEAGAEDCACPQLGGHSAISSQHFQAPSGQHRSVLPQDGASSPPQSGFCCELAALLPPEELVEELPDEDFPADDEADFPDDAGALEEAGLLEALEDFALEDFALEDFFTTHGATRLQLMPLFRR